jgi:hypothetical protein
LAIDRSLSPECTNLKHRYDQCFNAWFEGYLKPIVTSRVEDATPESDVEEEEDASPDLLESFVDDDEEECQEEEERDASATLSPAAGSAGSSHHHTHVPHHHHPSWSLRNDDKHPDLWPYSSRHVIPKNTASHIVKEASVNPTNVADDDDVPDQPLVEAVEAEFSDHTVSTPTEPKRSAVLQKPVLTIPLTTSSPKEQRAEWARAKKEEYDRNCGALWTDYRECLQVSSNLCLFRSHSRLHVEPP